MQQLIINPQSGLAGDMLTSALISAGVPRAEICAVMIDAASCLGGASIEIKEITRLTLTGVLLDITLSAPPHSTDGELIRTNLRNTLDKWKIRGKYSAFANQALNNLIKAEEEAHKKIDRLPHQHHHHCHLHEAQDILIDITGTAWALQYLQVDMEQVICLSPVITGSGKVHFSHGTLDVPAPATAAILKAHNIPSISGDLETELLTPTGAALIAAFKPGFLDRAAYLSSPYAAQAGTGFGTKDFSAKLGQPNALTLYLKT